MAAIDFAFVEQNTQQTTTGVAYADVSGCSITSGNFTAGKKYLILITAQMASNLAGNLSALQVVHGSTAFAESEMEWYPPNTGNQWAPFSYLTVWTAVSSEAITLQMKTNSGNTARVNFVAMFKMNLTDDLTENTDWFYNERTTDDGLTTSHTNGATVTFTPGTAGQDWLVLALTQSYKTSGSEGTICRINRSGEASSSVPTVTHYPQTSTSYNQYLLGRTFNLGASSNTFTESSALTSGTAGTRFNSKVFVLNLSKFDTNASANTDTDTNLSATDYATLLQSVDIAPPTTTVFVLATWGSDLGQYARRTEWRHQNYVVAESQVDVPNGQTTANYQFSWGCDVNSTGEAPYALLTRYSATSGNTYRSDLDGSADSTSGTPAAQYRSLVAWTAELAAAAPPAGVLARGLTKTFV